MSDPGTASIEVNHIPDGHIIVGHITQLKVLDEHGDLYTAMRVQGLNDMESYGMAHDLVDNCRTQLQGGKQEIE